MADAALSIGFAGPLVTLQDPGRPGHMRHGVPASGPMDRLSFDAAHAALGNSPEQTAIEISLGGLVLTCTSGEVTLAVTGGVFTVEHEGRKSEGWNSLTLRKGERLAIRAGAEGSWAYLAFSGVLQSKTWLGSAATHSTSGFGGGALCAGQTLAVHDTAVREDREGEIPPPHFLSGDSVRVVLGPQDHCFVSQAKELLLSTPFKVSDAYDRMGMRLDGPALALDGALSIPSEPVLRGSVQVSGDGIATILLADHQTTGGYPKIATVISSDLDRVVQCRAGQTLRFSTVTPQEAVSQARDYNAARQSYLDKIRMARDSLAQRLMRENLIHGFIAD